MKHEADGVQHMLNSLRDLYWRETHDSKPSRLEPSRAGCVAGWRPIEHLAPDLDHQARRQAGEINDVRPDRGLASKLETVELPASQTRPQVPLDSAHRASEIAGQLDSG